MMMIMVIKNDNLLDCMILYSHSLCFPIAGCKGLSSTITLGGETRGELGGSLAPLLPAWRPAISSAPELSTICT